MLSQEHVTPKSEKETPAIIFSPRTETNALLPSHLNDKLEEAVDQVCAPLIGTVPRPFRLAKHQELRAELDTLVAAHRELDVDLEQAVEAAVDHFRRLHPDLRAGLVNPQRSDNLVTVPQAQTLQATLSANQESRPAMLLSLGLLSSVYFAHIYNGAERIREFLGLSDTALYRWELIGVPLIVGLIVGLIVRRRSVRGALFACGALAAYAVLFPSLLIGLIYAGVVPHDSAIYDHIVPNPIAGYSGLVLWPVLTCGAAALGAKLRKRKAE